MQIVFRPPLQKSNDSFHVQTTNEAFPCDDHPASHTCATWPHYADKQEGDCFSFEALFIMAHIAACSRKDSPVHYFVPGLNPLFLSDAPRS